MTTRPLSDEENKMLANRREEFNAFLETMPDELAYFAELLELPNPQKICVKPDDYLPAISELLSNELIDKEDFTSLAADIGSFIGLVLLERLNGSWFINEWPDTRYFLRCVVGRFHRGSGGATMVDPFEAAAEFLSAPPVRHLDVFVAEIEEECRRQMALRP